jgi:hypothetical protein
MSMEVAEHNGNHDSTETRDTLFLLGGAAMVVFGAGLILSTPAIRKLMGGGGIGNLLQAAIPDFERYLKLRSM